MNVGYNTYKVGGERGERCRKKGLEHKWQNKFKYLKDELELTTASNSRFNEGVQLLVASDSQLQVAWGDSLHLQIFRRVSCQLQYLNMKTGTLNNRFDKSRLNAVS